MEDATAAKSTVIEPDLGGFDLDLAAILQAVDVEESPFGEYIKDCPLCKSAVRYFFVNFNEKLKMCENTECHYPFGYEDLEFVKHDDTFASDDELESITMSRPTDTASVISTTAWSDIDRLNKADDDDQYDITIQKSDASRNARLQEMFKQKEAELQTKKNLQDIKKLNVQLQKTYEEDHIPCIKNAKWIKHLQTLQSLSGVKLLKTEELALLSKPELGPQELTIGIDNGNASITINLIKPSTSTEVTNGNDSGTMETGSMLSTNTKNIEDILPENTEEHEVTISKNTEEIVEVPTNIMRSNDSVSINTKEIERASSTEEVRDTVSTNKKEIEDTVSTNTKKTKSIVSTETKNMDMISTDTAEIEDMVF